MQNYFFSEENKVVVCLALKCLGLERLFRETKGKYFFRLCTHSISCHTLHPHIIYQAVIGTVIEYFSEAYPAWPTYLCKLAVLGTKAARSIVADFNPLC